MEDYLCPIAAGPIQAAVSLPGSKSLTNRALVIAALADGPSLLSDVLLAEDTRLMIEALRALGVRITVDENDCVAEITGCGGQLPVSEVALACGNSGTTMRFCAALTALANGEYTLDGVARMRERPIGGLVETLQALGANIEYLGQAGFPPIRVSAGGLNGGHVSFHSPESSQLVSALLLVSPYARRDVYIDVMGDVPSVPYLVMTTKLMDLFGVVVVEQFAYQALDSDPQALAAQPSRRVRACKFIVESSQRYRGLSWTVEPDASNATYFLSIPAIVGGRLSVDGLGTESIQGDAKFVDVLEKMGCSITREAHCLTVEGPNDGQRLRGIDVDLNEMPDTAQTLAVLSLFADGPTTIRNVSNLRVKETDRLSAMSTELTKLGAVVDEKADGLTIHPPQVLQPARIETYNDHRMAMSFALAGLIHQGVSIADPHCCSKTFPDFFDRWTSLIGSIDTR